MTTFPGRVNARHGHFYDGGCRETELCVLCGIPCSGYTAFSVTSWCVDGHLCLACVKQHPNEAEDIVHWVKHKIHNVAIKVPER